MPEAFDEFERAMAFRRITFFAFLVLLASLLPGFVLAGMLGWNHLLFGVTPEQAGTNFRLINRVITCVAVSSVYLWFLWPIKEKLFGHALLVFLAMEATQSFLSLLVTDSLADAFVWQSVLTDAVYCAMGLSLMGLRRILGSRSVA